MKKILLTSLLFSSVIACDPTSQTYYETPVPPEVKEFKAAGATARGEAVKYDPRVDILFVIDNSASMKNHQINLRNNINQFLSAIDKTKVIDFHIGVTTVYDSVRYGTKVPKTCPDGRLNFEDNGVLQPLKGLATPVEERFVTRKDGYLQVLKETLNVGALEYIDADPNKPEVCAQGPEIEESLSPIIESFNANNVAGPNKNFWREDTLKVVIIVTDALDSSPNLTPSQVAAELYRQSESEMNDKKFRVYAVTMIPDTKVNSKTGTVSGSSCKLDPEFKNRNNNRWPTTIPDHSIAELVRITDGKLLSICQSNYGAELAKVGEEIRQATLKNIVHELPDLPDRTPGRDLQVWFKKGQTSLKLTEHKDWHYNPQTNKIVVYGINLDWDNNPDAYIDVDYFPVDPNNPENRVIQ